MADPIFNRSNVLHGPAWGAAEVTPNDSEDLPRIPTQALYIGGPGSGSVDVSVVMASGVTVLFEGVAHGTILPIRVDRVRATGTSAGAAIVALYQD